MGSRIIMTTSRLGQGEPDYCGSKQKKKVWLNVEMNPV
jgi:hypothetical protein